MNTTYKNIIEEVEKKVTWKEIIKYLKKSEKKFEKRYAASKYC